MYDHEKSDPAIVAVKPTNKAGQLAAELMEPRAGAEGNVSQQSTGRAQYRGTVSQALKRIRQAARHHLYLQQNSPGQIPNQTEVPAGPHAGKVASHQTGTATEHASADSPAGKMVAAGRHRLFQLPRGADKRSDTD